MREILFRGKRVNNGGWVYGYYVFQRKRTGAFGQTVTELDRDRHLICSTLGDNCCEVIPETVGQYTGLTDKNGRKIFEGDIVCIRYRTGEICCSGDVQFSHGVYGAEWLGTKKNKSMVGGWGQLHNLRRFDDDIINDIEVIGNIYDNPELLKDEE